MINGGVAGGVKTVVSFDEIRSKLTTVAAEQPEVPGPAMDGTARHGSRE
jgi:hypothetical protein